jgi:putative membrane protein insertion efficiency factor
LSEAADTPQLHGRTGLVVASVLAAIRAYKILISPLFSGCCRYYPSCADYVSEAVAVHGVAYGLWLGARRLASCQPFGGHGVDPVPRARRP